MGRHINIPWCIHNAQIPGYSIGGHDCDGAYSVEEMHKAFLQEGYRPLGKRGCLDVTEKMNYMKSFSPDSTVYGKDNKSFGIVGHVRWNDDIWHASWHVWTL